MKIVQNTCLEIGEGWVEFQLRFLLKKTDGKLHVKTKAQYKTQTQQGTVPGTVYDAKRQRVKGET